MRTSDPACDKSKHVCEDIPNMYILTKSVTPGNVQLTFVHMSIGNKPLGESVTIFTLEGYLEAPAVVSIIVNTAFAIASDKIPIPVTKELLCSNVGDLSRSKKQRDWVALNIVLIPPFLTEAAIFDNKTEVENLLKVFVKCIDSKGEKEEDEKS